MNPTDVSDTRNIPSLDGFRAVSVSLVLLSHLSVLPAGARLLGSSATYLSPVGFLGVRIFFVISGFLITTLLIKERDATGTIRLGRFYLRRSLRIFPAYYAMLAVSAWAGVAPGAHWGWLASYAANLGPSEPYAVAHSWSLGVEEQFYLLWPLVLLVAGRRNGLRVALGTIAGLPIVRVAWFLLFNSGRLAFAVPHDFLAAGCALALAGERLASMPSWQRLMGARWVPLIAPALLAYHIAFAESYRWRFALDTIVGQGMCAVSIAVLLAWSITNAQSVAVARVLNLRPMRAIGVLSYSVYLWHLLAIRADASYGAGTALTLVLLFATMGYFLVERPMLSFRRWLASIVQTDRGNLAPNT